MNNAINGQHDDGTPITTSTFAGRVKLLIQQVGSATEIARKCGFSEGVVRSWRDGHTDPSRGRCVTLAKTLGISLVWLVAGEGPIQADPRVNNDDATLSSSVEELSRSGRFRSAANPLNPASSNSVDPQRLAAAVKILQSNLQLADSPLTLADNTDLLAELYTVLGPGGVSDDPGSLVAFNQHLSDRVRKERLALA